MGGLNSDWLRQLAPDHAPAPPGWWPPAPGWWLLALLAVLAIAALIHVYRRPANRLRRIAMREFERIAASDDDPLLADKLQNLMRRYALAAFGRETVAGLSGESWIAFVATHGGEALAGETGARMMRAAYGGQSPADRQRWLEGARGFLRGRT